MVAQKSFDVAAGGSQVLYFEGHGRYDAYRLEFDSANSGSTDVDVTWKVDSDYPGDVEANKTFSSMDAQVNSATTVDASSGDPHVGNTAAGRTVAVEINEQGTTNGVEGTVYAHNKSDPAQNAEAFANR